MGTYEEEYRKLPTTQAIMNMAKSDNDACKEHAEIEHENFSFQEAHDFSRWAVT